MGKQFKDIWREWREDNGFTSKGLAERLGVKPPHISQIESGKRPASREMICRFAAIVGKDPLPLLEALAVYSNEHHYAAWLKGVGKHVRSETKHAA